MALGGLAAGRGAATSDEDAPFLAELRERNEDYITVEARLPDGIDAEGRNVGGLVFSSLPEEAPVKLDLTRATVSPSPSSVVDSYPPYWDWRIPKQSVSVAVPVSVPEDADPGEYQYAVLAYDFPNRGPEASVSETFAITVVDR